MRCSLFLLVLAAPALADPESSTGPTALEVLELARQIRAEDIRVIDASELSVSELMAMAVAERRDATRLQCCDWGGSCLPHDPGS